MRPMLTLAAVALVTAAISIALPSAAQRQLPVREGELLYQTHCVACHDKQVHWREKKLVDDWPSLAAEVNRWQVNLGLGCNDETVEEVTRYLNGAFYRFPDQSRRLTG
jgi:mono/diheme cytochrome c family protein